MVVKVDCTNSNYLDKKYPKAKTIINKIIESDNLNYISFKYIRLKY